MCLEESKIKVYLQKIQIHSSKILSFKTNFEKNIDIKVVVDKIMKKSILWWAQHHYCYKLKNKTSSIVSYIKMEFSKLKKSCKLLKTPGPISSSNHIIMNKHMTCQGRIKQWKNVPNNHFGLILGIEVRTTWLFHVKISKVGIFCPPV